MSRAGHLVAKIVAGGWRSEPPEPAVAEEDLARVLDRVLASGSGGLAWWKAYRLEQAGASQRKPPTSTRQLSVLRNAYRHNRLRAAIQERRIATTVMRLRRAGIECVLVKGWAAARSYADPGLRPVGDIDLIVRPQDLADARRLLADGVTRLEMDLGRDDRTGHDHLGPAATDPHMLLARSVLVTIHGVDVHVPSEEDHLRILCRHLLAHGAARPVWLCDVAAAVERRSQGFDWDRTIPDDPIEARWAAAALGLAAHLVGLDLAGTPFAGADERLPGWLARAVLREWSDPARFFPPQAWRTIGGVGPSLRALRLRWPPNPIAEAVAHHRPLTHAPRLAYQVSDGLQRAWRHRRNQEHRSPRWPVPPAASAPEHHRLRSRATRSNCSVPSATAPANRI